MRVSVAIAVVATFVPSLVAAAYDWYPSTAFSYKVDYIDVNQKQSLGECKQSCDGSSGCIAFIFEPSTGYCYFKDKIVGPYNTSQYDSYVRTGKSILGTSTGASGFKKYAGTQLVGTATPAFIGIFDVNTDLSEAPTSQSVNYCAAWCFQSATCVAFGYAPSRGKCYLKDSVRSASTDTTMDAYVKTGYSLTQSGIVADGGDSNVALIAGIAAAVGVLVIIVAGTILFLLMRKRRNAERKPADPQPLQMSNFGHPLQTGSPQPPLSERTIYVATPQGDSNKMYMLQPGTPMPANTPPSSLGWGSNPSGPMSSGPASFPSVSTQSGPLMQAHWFFNQVAAPQGLQNAMSAQCQHLQPFLVAENFQASTDDEIDLVKDQMVTLSVCFRDGWGIGYNNATGKSGVLPIDCLRLSENVPMVSTISVRRESTNLSMPMRSMLFPNQSMALPDLGSQYTMGSQQYSSVDGVNSGLIPRP